MTMLFVTLYGNKVALIDEAKTLWSAQAVVRAEIAQLLPVLRERNAILAEAHSLDPAIPLRLHASYLSAEVGAAVDARTVDGGLRPFYTGVETVADGRFDVIFVTRGGGSRRRGQRRSDRGHPPATDSRRAFGPSPCYANRMPDEPLKRTEADLGDGPMAREGVVGARTYDSSRAMAARRGSTRRTGLARGSW
jgi:hypothetical protein